MRDIASYLLKYKKNVFIGILMLLVVDGTQIVIPMVIQRVIDRIALGRVTPSGLFKYALIILGLALIIAVFRFLWRWFIIRTARLIEERIRNELYEHILKLPARFFMKMKTGDIMAHATNDLDAIRMSMGIGVVATTDVVIISTFSLIAMISISPKLTLYAMIPMPFLSFVVLKFGKLIHSRFEAVQRAFSNLTETVREYVSGIRVIKAFAQEKGAVEEFSHINRNFVDVNMKLVKVFGLFHPIIMFFATLTTGITLLAGGTSVILNRVTIGQFVAFNYYLGMMVWPMIAIGWATNVLQRGAASMKRVKRILHEEPEPVHLGLKRRIEGDIEFKNLTFSYDGKPILENISFLLERGTKLGIMGRTGSGKSTLVLLIPRIYDPPPGSVFVDGKDVLEYNLISLRKSIGYVPQDGFLFSTTIRENIAFGREDATDEEIEWAAKMAEIYDEIMEFPDGFDTLVGERGVTLSGGQKQRIAIARALLVNPSVLILDDALSQVDAETEAKILANLREFMKERTSIVVSHRVSAVMDADLIIVLENGRILESGTHEELLEQKGIYYDFYEMQRFEELVSGEQV